MRGRIEAAFPSLRNTSWNITSCATRSYNCIAWAAGDSQRWWWPDPYDQYYWPEQVPREKTLERFIEAFGLDGYSQCQDGSFEPEFEKIAIYAGTDGRPTHAARQCSDGSWTSKLGEEADISHVNPESLNSLTYGQAVAFLRRPRSRTIDI